VLTPIEAMLLNSRKDRKDGYVGNNSSLTSIKTTKNNSILKYINEGQPSPLF